MYEYVCICVCVSLCVRVCARAVQNIFLRCLTYVRINKYYFTSTVLQFRCDLGDS